MAQEFHIEFAPRTAVHVEDAEPLGAVQVLVERVAGNPTQEQINTAVAAYIEEHPGSISGLSDAAKVALLQIAEKVAYIDEHGQDYYDALYAAFYPPAELVGITAVYTQSGAVYESTPLDDLKSDLVVTALYSDSTSEVITSGYTLSGTLTVGTSTITVAYSGKITTFTVTVSEAQEELWIEQLGATGYTSAFNYSPFVFGTNAYDYDYGKAITAIEADFSTTGNVSIGYCSVGTPSGTYDSSTMTWVETFTVGSTGVHKLTLETPLSLPSGCSLAIGQPSDSAKFKYGGSKTNGFVYNNGGRWQTQARKLGINVYRR